MHPVTRLEIKTKDKITLFNDQLLGEYLMFPEDLLAEMSINENDVDDNGCFKKEVSLEKLINCFKEYHVTHLFPKINKLSWKELTTSSFLNFPSDTIVGKYAIVMHSLQTVSYKYRPHEITVTLSVE